MGVMKAQKTMKGGRELEERSAEKQQQEATAIEHKKLNEIPKKGSTPKMTSNFRGAAFLKLQKKK
jgi:hypothetical protein